MSFISGFLSNIDKLQELMMMMMKGQEVDLRHLEEVIDHDGA